MKVYPATVACADRHVLAEGPVWDPARDRVLWVDVNAHRVHSGVLRDGRVLPTARLDFPGTVGAVVCSAGGRLLVAGAHELTVVEPDGRRTPLVRLIPPGTDSRLNDGGCDPAGRFLVGSLALDGRRGAEALHRIEHTGAVTVVDDDLTLSNGLAWSPDGSRFYSTDTIPGVIWVRPYDPASGAYGERTELLRITDGSPDGLCVDTDGNLWIAIWGAGEVRCHTPAGEHLATVRVPAPNTSSVAFVGPGRDTLLITTASEQLTPDQLAEFPDSGRLFTARVGAVGLPVPYWSGDGR